MIWMVLIGDLLKLGRAVAAAVATTRQTGSPGGDKALAVIKRRMAATMNGNGFAGFQRRDA